MKLPIQLDRYTLVEAIGAGAFGRVYRAEVRGDMGFVSDFAVKVLDANVVQTNPNVAAQMADEARLLSQLDHPNIVKVIDFKYVDHFVLGDVYMMVLEFVRGVDVAEILERLSVTRGSIPATAVLHMGVMVADALNHAYSMTTRDGNALRLVHRDLKPHNLMVNFRGQVKILDFGIAKAKSARMAAATQEGQTKGTVFYMSPEQLAGEELDGRSDLYSLGTILFELLYGRRLLDVEVNTPADLARAMHTAFEMDIEDRLQDLRKHLASGANGDLSTKAIEGWLALLRAALQKDARYRPDSARSFAEQLEWLRAKHDVHDRGFWPRVVEEVAAERAARGGRALGPAPTPPPKRRPQTVEDLTASDLSLNESAQGFFGMESGSIADDAPAQLAPMEVPMTRAMSSVRGTVRSFGSEQIQQISPLKQISPLTEVIARVRSGEDSGPRRMDDSTDSLTVPGIARKNSDKPFDAPTVETDAVSKQTKPEKSAKTTSKRALQEADTYVPPAPTPRGAPERPRNKSQNQKVLTLLAAVAAVLLLLIGFLLARRGGDPETDPGAEVAASEQAVENERVTTAEAALVPEAPSEEPPPEDGEAVAADEPGPAAPESAEEPPPEAKSQTLQDPTPTPARAEPTPRPTPKAEPVAKPAPSEPIASAAGAEPGILHISARPRCNIEIDGQDRGTSDETRLGVVLPPGTYSVRWVCSKDEPECAQFKRRSGRKTVEVRSGEKDRYHVDFYKLAEKYK